MKNRIFVRGLNSYVTSIKCIFVTFMYKMQLEPVHTQKFYCFSIGKFVLCIPHKETCWRINPSFNYFAWLLNAKDKIYNCIIIVNFQINKAIQITCGDLPSVYAQKVSSKEFCRISILKLTPLQDVKIQEKEFAVA